MVPRDEYEIKKERILELADYIIKHKASTRKTSRYIKDHKKYKYSHVTIHKYMTEELPKIDITKFKEVMKVLAENKASDLDSEMIEQRILIEAELYLTEKMKIEEIIEFFIQNKMPISFETVYNDLYNKLEKINPELALQVKQQGESNRMENLRQK